MLILILIFAKHDFEMQKSDFWKWNNFPWVVAAAAALKFTEAAHAKYLWTQDSVWIEVSTKWCVRKHSFSVLVDLSPASMTF